MFIPVTYYQVITRWFVVLKFTDSILYSLNCNFRVLTRLIVCTIFIFKRSYPGSVVIKIFLLTPNIVPTFFNIFSGWCFFDICWISSKWSLYISWVVRKLFIYSFSFWCLFLVRQSCRFCFKLMLFWCDS